jgi:Arc/MetJ family transcription regulator
MKTSLNIPDKLMKAAMRRAKAPTRTRAVVMALEEFVRRQEVDELLELEGKIGYWSRDEWWEFRHGKPRAR